MSGAKCDYSSLNVRAGGVCNVHADYRARAAGRYASHDGGVA
jgi:hypothetical protein